VAVVLAGGAAAQAQVLLDREVLEDAAVLGHQREAGPHQAGGLGAGDVGAVEAHAAGGRAQQPGHRVQQRGLASAVGPHESHQLTLHALRAKRRAAR
jgi:hypothetical protein